jgi:uncharacterized coiled-coil DUF342 family protein
VTAPMRPVQDDEQPTIAEVRALRRAGVSMADELILRRCAVRELKAEVAALRAERDELRLVVEELRRQFNDFVAGVSS